MIAASATKKVLFLTLKTFSFTGGIEKFNRAFSKALTDLEGESKLSATNWSIYDDQPDERYCVAGRFKGFKGAKISFIWNVIKTATRFDTIIISHINLSLPVWCIKKIFPRKQVILVTHGIEVWEKQTGVRKQLLKCADIILAVSAFTKQRIIDIHQISPEKVVVFHNTIDPFFVFPATFEKPQYLLDRYGLQADVKVLFTLTRLQQTEHRKGYDQVISCLKQVTEKFPGTQYLLAGKPAPAEKIRIGKLLADNEVTAQVQLTGFIADEEITDHYLLADTFILPSQKEGFGIVFIEAMACGLPVIAGNKDGSVDALQQGLLGTLVDPDHVEAIREAIITNLHDATMRTPETKKQLQQKVQAAFGFKVFKSNLQEILA